MSRGVSRREVQALKMSRWKIGGAEGRADTFRLGHCSRRRHDRRSEETSSAASGSSCPFILSFANFAVLFAFVCWGPETSRAQQPDFGVYARAVEYCRGVVKRPLALDLDKRVLCFDGVILRETDVSLANALEPNGPFRGSKFRR
jgi:hypothetical protein